MNVDRLFDELVNPENEKAIDTSDKLAEIGSEEVLQRLIELLEHKDLEIKFIAAKTLGKIPDNEAALNPLLEAIGQPANKDIAGDLLMALDGFDVSENYVSIFRLYLFGSFKVSRIAEELLDYKEFTITPRVIKKARKHWNHYANNVKHDDLFQLRKKEVEERLFGLEEFVNRIN